MQLTTLRIGAFTPQYPIIQGGMSVKVSTASLASEVSRAGGIGVIGGTGIHPDELREEIRQARSQISQGILGVNIMFAAKQFRESVESAIHEGIDIIFTGAGFSREIFHLGRAHQVPIVPIVSSVRAAQLAERCGAAAVVAEGCEAGGHLGTDRSIYDILPEIKQQVNIPVVAAGGIVDGFDMAAMVRLGADGVQMATRFVLSQECSVADEFKQVYLQAQEGDMIIIKSPVGMPGRALRTPFTDLIDTEDYKPSTKCVQCLKDCNHSFCINQALVEAKNGNISSGLVFAGQNVVRITEILPVADIFNKTLTEYASV